MLFYWKKIIVLSFCLCLPLQTVSAADQYPVIFNLVSAYNGNSQEADWITRAILYASSVYGVDPKLVASVMKQESQFRITTVSPVGAIGLMQLMPDTAAMMGVNPYNPLDNVLGGVAYLRTQMNEFAGWGKYAITVALAAYNAGPNAVFEYGGVPPFSETHAYIRGITATYHALS